MKKRGCGILMHISSLPSNYGIGTFGEEAYKFVDFLYETKQTYWQILPLGQTSYGDSPYQSFSINGGNPYFIDLEMLIEENLLKLEEVEEKNWGSDEKVDYSNLYNLRYEVLKNAFERFEKTDEDYKKFIENNKEWIEDYSIFMALKKYHEDKSWDNWEKKYKTRDKKALEKFKDENRENIEFWCFIQYKFYEQWSKLKKYANEKNIKIIGDIPIYVAYDSVEVWKNPEYFQLDSELKMINVAGCPPDSFSPTGQLWGNPLYNWEYMEKTGYKWWLKRLADATKIYDVVRIDHFRGFESYYSIPAEDKDAMNGKWEKGPGMKLFNKVKEELGELDLIAEDLGYLTQEVMDLLKDSGYPGMKLLQFAFDSREDGDYLPHNYVENSIVYIGTHDNDTGIGWLINAKTEDIEYMRNYLDIYSFDDRETVWKMICRVFATTSRVAIIQMQDYLGVGIEGRMNTPSTLGNNWVWRMRKNQIDSGVVEGIKYITNLYKR